MAKAEIQLNREHKQAYYLQMYSMIMTFVALNFEILLGKESLDLLHFIKMLLWALFFNLFFKSLYRLEMSFWMFSLFLFFYLGSCLVGTLIHRDSYVLFYMYMTANVALWMELYMMSSPIFFPRTSWWEYDFRFRSELKIDVEIHTGAQVESFTGRMTDIRRQAACVVLFHEIPKKKKIIIKSTDFGYPVELKAVVISKREYSFGRGLTYGVKLLVKTPAEKKMFKQFHHSWRQLILHKLKMKFMHLTEHHKEKKKDSNHELPY